MFVLYLYGHSDRPKVGHSHTMHLATTTDPAPLRISYSLAPAADTYCPKEAAALRQVVAETHLGGPLLPTVQSAVVLAKMTREENWTCEALALLEEFGAAPASAALMHLA